MAKPFVCPLCAAAGLPSGPRRVGRSVVCANHHTSLRASGHAWCNRGCHVVPLERMAARQTWCKACEADRKRGHARGSTGLRIAHPLPRTRPEGIADQILNAWAVLASPEFLSSFDPAE